VFVFYPFLRNFKLRSTRTPVSEPAEPLRGLHQAATVLSSSAFLQSLLSTILFVLMVVPTGLFLGWRWRSPRTASSRHRHLRVIFSSTVVSSVAVAALVFAPS